MVGNGACTREGAAPEQRGEGTRLDKKVSPLSMPTDGGFIPLGEGKFMDEETGGVYDSRKQIQIETSHARDNDYEIPCVALPPKEFWEMFRGGVRGLVLYVPRKIGKLFGSKRKK